MTDQQQRAKLRASIKFTRIYGLTFCISMLIFSLVLLFLLPLELQPGVWMLMLVAGLGAHYTISTWREDLQDEDANGGSLPAAGRPA